MRCVQISRENIQNNVNEVKKLQPNKEIMVVLKGNAYGHGVIEVATCLYEMDVKTYCVATIEEAIQLRKKFDDVNILVLYGVWDQDLHLFKKYDIELTITSIEEYHKHKKFIFENNLKVHLKFDSGMNRMGIKDINQLKLIKEDLITHKFKLKGLYTHIAQYEVSYEIAKNEIEKFEEVVKLFEDIEIEKIHYMNSASIQMFKTSFDNAIRIGNFLYGYYDFDKDYAQNHLAKYDIFENLNIKPILRLKTTLKMIKDLKVGEFIGYGNTTAKSEMRIGIVDYGKLDGIIKVVNHQINLNSQKRINITPAAMNHMFIKLNEQDKLGDNIYLYEDLNYQAKQLNCRPIDFIAYLDSSLKRQLVDSFNEE